MFSPFVLRDFNHRLFPACIIFESPLWDVFEVSHSLINWYVVWTSVYISCFGYIAIDTNPPKLPLPLPGTPKSGIMQGCDYSIQVIYSLRSVS